MAINSKRMAISHMVYGALPPHSTNVLWMDTSVPELPVCKIFWNGCWTSVHTDDSKEIALLAKVVEELSSTTQSQENTIAQLSEQILAAIQAIDLSWVATEANATTNKEAILTAVSNLQTALQGSDTTATNTALATRIGTPASGQPTDLFAAIAAGGGGDAQESTSQEILGKVNTLTALDSDIAEGKQAVAAAVTAKGVQTTSTDSLAQMAENIGNIQQTTTVIDGGDMYAAQLTGNGTLWDLYSVLAQMKSQYIGAGHYAALIVCEYYRGYASLQLQGADAYYTCDGDFYNTSSPLHVWHDDDNGKTNRWVCFLYASEGARLDITNTDISPLSMYIGGHIGTIEYFVNGSLTDFVCGVEETDVVDNLVFSTYTQQFGRNVIIKNVGNTNLNAWCKSSSGLLKISGIKNITTNDYNSEQSVFYALILPDLETHAVSNGSIIKQCNNCVYLETPKLTRITGGYGAISYLCASLVQMIMPMLNFCIKEFLYSTANNLIDIEVGEMTTNIRCSGWNPTTVLADAGKKAQLIDNIKNHILAKVSDRTGDTQLVFTVSTNMYNEIASENIIWNNETMTLADAFLTKNWLFAGA